MSSDLATTRVQTYSATSLGLGLPDSAVRVSLARLCLLPSPCPWPCRAGVCRRPFGLPLLRAVAVVRPCALCATSPVAVCLYIFFLSLSSYPASRSGRPSFVTFRLQHFCDLARNSSLPLVPRAAPQTILLNPLNQVKCLLVPCLGKLLLLALLAVAWVSSLSRHQPGRQAALVPANPHISKVSITQLPRSLKQHWSRIVEEGPSSRSMLTWTRR